MSVDGITRGIEIGITIGTGIATVTETGIMIDITKGIVIMIGGASTTATKRDQVAAHRLIGNHRLAVGEFAHNPVAPCTPTPRNLASCWIVPGALSGFSSSSTASRDCSSSAIWISSNSSR